MSPDVFKCGQISLARVSAQDAIQNQPPPGARITGWRWTAGQKTPEITACSSFCEAHLGVSVEDLLSADLVAEPKRGPVGRMQKVFADVSQLPRRQQAKIIELVEALVDQYRRKAS
jgi:hypothetical protein